MRWRTRPALSTPPLNRTWVGQAKPLGPRRTAPLLGGGGLLAEESRQLPGDGGIGGVGQSDFLQAGPPLEHGHLGAGHGRQEALPEHAVDIFAQEGGLDGAADQAVPMPQMVTACYPWPWNPVRAASPWPRGSFVPEGLQLAAVDSGPLLRQPFGDDVARARSMLSPPRSMCSPTAHAGKASAPPVR